MKKTSLFLVFLFSLGVFQMRAEKKDVVYVDNFTYPSAVEKAYIETFRNKIIEGIAKKERVILKDANLEASFKNQKQKAGGDGVVDENTLTKMKALKADYFIQGHITTMGAKTTTRKDETIKYDGVIVYSLTIVNVKTGIIKGTESYKYPSGLFSRAGVGDTAEEAVTNVMREIENDMDKLVEKYFGMEAKILQVSKEEKGKVTEVYINLGAKDGIQKGQKFEIFVERNIAGRIAESKIGELQAEAIEADDLTRCKVNGGKTQEALKNAMSEGATIVLKSVMKGEGLLGGTKRVMGI